MNERACVARDCRQAAALALCSASLIRGGAASHTTCRGGLGAQQCSCLVPALHATSRPSNQHPPNESSLHPSPHLNHHPPNPAQPPGPLDPVIPPPFTEEQLRNPGTSRWDQLAHPLPLALLAPLPADWTGVRCRAAHLHRAQPNLDPNFAYLNLN